MSEIDVFLISFFLCLIINYILPKYNFLIDKKFFPHKSFVSKNSVPISGGLIFILSALLFLKFENYFNYIIFLIFFVGVLSDLNILKSPYKRFFLQITVIFSFSFFLVKFLYLLLEFLYLIICLHLLYLNIFLLSFVY